MLKRSGWIRERCGPQFMVRQIPGTAIPGAAIPVAAIPVAATLC
jgi:hypothetical protein